MFARLVESPAKPGKKDDLIAILSKELQPLIKKQPGFVDFVGLTSDTQPELGLTMTFWDTKANAEKFWSSQDMEKILIKMKPLMEDMRIRTFNVEVSTFHKIATGKAA